MRKLSCLYFLLLMGLLLPLPATATTLTELRQLERTALRNNLDLRTSTYTTRASEALVRKGYGIYDPQARFMFAERGRTEYINQRDFNAESKSKNRHFDFSIIQRLSTGADLTLDFDTLRQDSELGASINPAYEREVSLSLVQPLLKGFGKTVTEQEILLAVHDREQAVEDLRVQAAVLLAAVRNAYFEVLRYRDELSFRDSSFALAEKVLKENRARVAAGVFAPIELLEAEVGLVRREQDRLDTDRDYRDALDNLSLLLGPQQQIPIAAETLSRPQLRIDEEEGYRLALSQRPELLRQVSEIAKTGLELRLVQNNMLPQLDLAGSYARRGLDNSYQSSLADFSQEDYHSWEIGLTLSYSLGNRVARNEYWRIQNRLKSQQTDQVQQREEVRKEIRRAMRLIEMNDKKIDVASKGRALAEKKLANLLKRHKVGLSTTRDVLEGEEDLARAHTGQIAALVAYNNALTEYLRVTGQLLSHEGVRLVGTPDQEKDDSPFEMSDR